MGTPKYKIIYDQIVKFILTDVWPVGSNMKSENELIKLFGVSRLTIRNVLNILENEGRILRSRGKATLILDRLLQNNNRSEIKDFSVTLNADYKLIDVEIVKNNLIKKFNNGTNNVPGYNEGTGMISAMDGIAKMREQYVIHFPFIYRNCHNRS